MDEPTEFDLTPTIPIHIVARARELADSAQASGMAMDFDTALGYTEQLEHAQKLPMVSDRPDQPSIADISSPGVYKLVEAVDVALSFDPDENRRWNAAALAVDLNSSLPFLPGKDANDRATILSSTLGISGGTEQSVAQQLVDKYFSDTDEGRFALEAITERARLVTK